MADIPPHDSAQLSKERKRTRVQLSCTACRSRKLKCCRTHPCNNCMKRGEANSCTFIGRGPRGRTSHGQPSPTHVQDRLQHLENLILSFAQKKKQDEHQGQESSPSLQPPAQDLSSNHQPAQTTPLVTSSEGTESENAGLSPGQCGKLVVTDSGTSYIDSAHWKAILEEISEFKESLYGNDESSDDDTIDENGSHGAEPTIWLGLTKPSSKEELVSDIPPKPVTDRLVSYYLFSKEPMISKQYNRFWANPQDLPLAWIAMLYSILTLSTFFHQRVGNPIYGLSGDYQDIILRFTKRSAQCLIQSNYIAAGRYKVEALFLHTMGEFYKKHDVGTSVPFLLSITIKLAMRMGYHRDPSQFPAISPFDGEMRRRMWTFLCQLDALLSFEIGMPRTIQDWQYDTELPRNLSDEDFDEDTVNLPPSRPTNETTIASYTIAKSPLMMTFGKIFDMAISQRPITYEETLEADRRLEEAHSLISGPYKYRPIYRNIADPPQLIFQRFTLENLYQKSRLVLHRRYLGEAHTNSRYAYSRIVCMNASKAILRVYADLFREIQPAGLMYRNRLFPNSIQYTDYLLAAMILCMELLYSHTAGSKAARDDDIAVLVKDRDDLIATLETSHQILEDLSKHSADGQKAHAALTVMLQRVKSGLHTISPWKTKGPSPAANSQVSEPSYVLINTAQPPPPPYDGWSNFATPNFVDPKLSSDMIPNQLSAIDPPYLSLDVIGEMLDTPANIDWQLFDQEMLNRPNPVPNIDGWYQQ
ncbi:hypothetical protein BJY04DRAFT_205219 [Aspergillus karnatakaensis]|uniref:putative C6 transcription factor n=1 Tax=Aspergillus karnatakaensis TaxID=1810916 RepID=UPI003CCE0E3F